MTDHDRLRHLANNATPGPWHVYDRGVGYYVCTSVGPGEYDYTPLPEGLRTDLGSHQAAEFIAAANPSVVLGLLDELAAREAEVHRLRDLADTLRTELGVSKEDVWDQAAEYYGVGAADVRDGMNANPYREGTR